jgi:hypothetical protein
MANSSSGGGRRSVASRLAARQARVDAEKIRTGQQSEDEDESTLNQS